jgi:vacuolar protein sorting-associated protein 13A/C
MLQGLPIVDDGNDHSYFCALRLLIGNHTSDQYKVFPQSARTRCVKPVKTTELQTHDAKWNEHFIFEVPEQVIFNVVVSVRYLYLHLTVHFCKPVLQYPMDRS